MITMTRLQANALATLISTHGPKAENVSLEQVTGLILKDSVAIAFKGVGSKPTRSFLVGQNGAWVTSS